MSVKFTVKAQRNPLNGSHGHWTRDHAVMKKCRAAVAFALMEIGRIPSAHDKLVLAKSPVKKSVKFTRFWGGRSREMDFEGFVASCKHYLDALKMSDDGEGLIYDDSQTWVALLYDQVKDKTKAGLLEIEVI